LQLAQLATQVEQGGYELFDVVMVTALEELEATRCLGVFLVVELVDSLEVTIEGEEEFCRPILASAWICAQMKKIYLLSRHVVDLPPRP
jgi:hypothetical protein